MRVHVPAHTMQHVLLSIALLLSLSLPSSSENGGAHSDSGSCTSRGNCAGADEHPRDQPQTAPPPPPPSPRQHGHARHASSDEAGGSEEDTRRKLREERQRRDERIKVEIERQQREAEAAAGASAQAFQSAAAADEHMRARQRSVQEQMLQQKLVHDQRRRQTAFIARSRAVSGGSLADSWGGGSTARKPQEDTVDKEGTGRAGLPEGSYTGSCDQCVLMGLAPNQQLRCTCKNGAGTDATSVLSLSACKNGEWVGNVDGILSCEPVSLGAEGSKTRGGGAEQVGGETRGRQESVEQFVQAQRELLSNLRLESTGTRERPEKKALRMDVTVPVGLEPGNVFNVDLDGKIHPVTVPEGVYGGHTLQLILEDGGDEDWNYHLKAAARINVSVESALAVAESMLNFFHVPEAQALACQAVQYMIDRSKEGSASATEVESRGFEVRSHFARVNMVEMILSSLRHHQHGGVVEVSMFGAQALANLLHSHKNNTAAAAAGGAAELMLSLIQQHPTHQQIPGFALGALVNMCTTAAGTSAVKRASFDAGDDNLVAIFRVLDLHEGNTDILNYGCLLLFRTTQNDQQRLHQLKAVKGSKDLENLVSSWLKASGGTGGVNYCNLLLHTAKGA